MTWVDKTFTNGEVLYAADLTEMVGNDTHVRFESNFRTLLTGAAIELAWYSESDFEIDGQDFGTSPSWNGSQWSEINIDISNVPNGLHTLSLYGREIKFMKTPDLQRVSYWFNVETINEGEPDEYQIATNMVVIGHRENQSWT